METAPKTEERHPEVIHLVTGHFHETAGYETWRARGTADWLLIATLDGGGRFGHAGGEFRTESGDLALFRPGTRHDYGVAPSLGHWELLWTHFHPRPDWAPYLAWPEAAPGLMRLRLDDGEVRRKALDRFGEAHALATGALPSAPRRREAFAMNALEAFLLWCDTQNPLSESQMDGRVRAAMEYLTRHLAVPVTMGALADACGLSVSRLAHLFRAQVGLAPQQFLEGQRLDRARQLLELTPRPVGAVAAEVGYENPFYFTQRFKRATGLSPRDYRKKYGGEAHPVAPPIRR
jgi:AraC family transcriptional regulator of arabinose operon